MCVCVYIYIVSYTELVVFYFFYFFRKEKAIAIFSCVVLSEIGASLSTSIHYIHTHLLYIFTYIHIYTLMQATRSGSMGGKEIEPRSAIGEKIKRRRRKKRKGSHTGLDI